MDYRKPQYLTSTGFTRSGLPKSSRVGKVPLKPLENKIKASIQPQKPFKLSEEAASQIARVISQMLKKK